MSQSPSPYQPPSPVEPAAPAPRRRSLTTILAIVGVVLLVPCVCCGGLAALMGRGVYVAATERGNVELVVDQYMRQMEARDAEGAYALFSARARRQTTREQIEQLQNGPFHELFTDYEKATVTNISVTTGFNSNQDQAQGTVANVQGTIAYSGGVGGTFRGVLEREGDQWRIHNINVNVPAGQVPKE